MMVSRPVLAGFLVVCSCMAVQAQEMGTSLSDPVRGSEPVRVLAPSGNSPNQLAVGADGEVGYYYVPAYPAPSEGGSDYDRRARSQSRTRSAGRLISGRELISPRLTRATQEADNRQGSSDPRLKELERQIERIRREDEEFERQVEERRRAFERESQERNRKMELLVEKINESRRQTSNDRDAFFVKLADLEKQFPVLMWSDISALLERYPKAERHPDVKALLATPKFSKMKEAAQSN
jgi:hypothetical protein